MASTRWEDKERPGRGRRWHWREPQCYHKSQALRSEKGQFRYLVLAKYHWMDLIQRPDRGQFRKEEYHWNIMLDFLHHYPHCNAILILGQALSHSWHHLNIWKYLCGLWTGVPSSWLPAPTADQLYRDGSIAQTSPSSAALAWQAVTPGSKLVCYRKLKEQEVSPVDSDLDHRLPSEAASLCAGVPSFYTSNT